MLYNDGCEADESKRAIKCPRCQNEDILKDGDYCKICGASVVNKCADMDIQDSYDRWHTEDGCGKVLDSNARYCPYCGNESTYLQSGILKPWEEAKKEIEAQELAAATSVSEETNQNDNNSSGGEFVEIDDPDGSLPF